MPSSYLLCKSSNRRSKVCMFVPMTNQIDGRPVHLESFAPSRCRHATPSQCSSCSRVSFFLFHDARCWTDVTNPYRGLVFSLVLFYLPSVVMFSAIFRPFSLACRWAARTPRQTSPEILLADHKNISGSGVRRRSSSGKNVPS